mgnify:CR=1 FL=1
MRLLAGLCLLCWLAAPLGAAERVVSIAPFLTDMVLQLDARSQLVGVLDDGQLHGELDNVTASMAKWWTTQKQCEIVDACLQLHGGNGYMLDYPIAHMYADARVQKIYGGSNEIMKELIGRSL